MTERITQTMVANSTINTIDNDLDQLDTTQEQLSTGYQINEPSDNPYGAALTLSLQSQISSITSYQSNISQATASTDTAASALTSIEQVTQDVRELVVEGANSTLNSTDLADAAQEVLQYIGQIKQTADTQYDGSYVFSGTAVDTAPYDEDASGSDTFSGNTDAVNASIGASTTLDVSTNLFGVLGNGTGTAGAVVGASDPTTATGGLLTTLRTIYDDMTGTNGGTSSDLSNQLTNLDSNITALEQVQAQNGATSDRLSLASDQLTTLTTSDQTSLSNVYDVDEAKATVEYSTEQASYEAALQSTADIVQESLMNFLQT